MTNTEYLFELNRLQAKISNMKMERDEALYKKKTEAKKKVSVLKDRILEIEKEIDNTNLYAENTCNKLRRSYEASIVQLQSEVSVLKVQFRKENK